MLAPRGTWPGLQPLQGMRSQWREIPLTPFAVAGSLDGVTGKTAAGGEGSQSGVDCAEIERDEAAGSGGQERGLVAVVHESVLHMATSRHPGAQTVAVAVAVGPIAAAAGADTRREAFEGFLSIGLTAASDRAASRQAFLEWAMLLAEVLVERSCPGWSSLTAVAESYSPN